MKEFRTSHFTQYRMMGMGEWKEMVSFSFVSKISFLFDHNCT